MSRCYQQLTLVDRRRLHHLVERKVPINEMARQLGRHRSTIYREIRRNTYHDRELPEYSGYFSTAYWSPEQIAGRLLVDGLSLVRICAETIYRFIYGKEDYAWAFIGICPRHAAGFVHVGRGSRETACSRPVTEYRNALILLAIGPGSAIGRATF